MTLQEHLNRRADVLRPRFTRIQYQLKSLIDMGPEVEQVLEVGPGHGYFASIAKSLNYSIFTLDRDPSTNADFTGNIHTFARPELFDAVFDFELLEQMP